MPKINVTATCQVEPSFRVAQIRGMFDLPAEVSERRCFEVDIPGLEDGWSCGAIVGPSGSGKSSVLLAAFGDYLAEPADWPADQAIVDALGDHPTRKIIDTLLAVGMGSTPAWLRPYQVLSGGEKFRADLARLLLSETKTIVCDEFTSLVDRTVAQVVSIAIRKVIGQKGYPRRLVVATCHEDIVSSLAPDWVLNMADQTCHWRSLRRDDLHLEIRRCQPSVWARFREHHYLNSKALPAAQFYGAVWQEEIVAVVALVGLWGRRGHKRVARVVTLPDYQGIGIGARLLDTVCEIEHTAGFQTHITAGHPGILRHCDRSPRWRLGKQYRGGRFDAKRKRGQTVKTSGGRHVASFSFCGEACEGG